jgi:UrcA family protein
MNARFPREKTPCYDHKSVAEELTRGPLGRIIMKVGTLHIALATIGALVVSGSGLAQQTPEVIVETPRVQKTTQAGPMGRPMPALSIVYRVSYADLDIGTHSGAVELEKRIRDSATKACEQLAKLYPETTEPAAGCVQSAVKNAMARANKAVAAAEKAGKK